MASNRIVINRSLPLGQNVANFIATLARAREMASELNLIIGKYNADATLATDLGCSAGDQTSFTNLLTQATNELNGTFSTAVGIGAAGGTRQLCDALSLTV